MQKSFHRVILFGGIILLALALVAMLALHQYQRYAEAESTGRLERSSFINAPYIKTQPPVVQKMVELSAPKPEELVYDLGCGDGRLVIAAVKSSGCRGVGFDIDPARIEESKVNAQSQEIEDRIEFREENIFEVDMSQCDIAMIYLTLTMIERLKPQLEKMKPGSRIVSQDFWIEQVRPDRMVLIEVLADEETGTTERHGVYLYTLPLKHDQTMEKGKPPQPSDAIDPTQ